MESIALTKARRSLTDVLLAAHGGERVRLSRNGKDFVAVISIEDLEFFEALEDRMDIEEAKAALKEGGSIPFEQVKRELGL
jgi:prevent-host-death family protein